MKARQTLCGLIAVTLSFAFVTLSLTGCDDDKGNEDKRAPEDKPVNERWSKWVADDSTAKLEYSVDKDGVCKITVTGTPISDAWKTTVRYSYTGKANTKYIYEFEAWTESGTRDLYVQYYEDNDERIYLGASIATLTTAKKTYRIYGDSLPKDGAQIVNFQCGRQLGTFYVKILSIKEYTIGTLTITNFSGDPGLTANNYVSGDAQYNDAYLMFGPSAEFDGDSLFTGSTRVTGSSITFKVFNVDWDAKTVIPFTGNATIAAGDLTISEYNVEDEEESYYTNKDSITFTNGNAAINFGTQMEVDDTRD